MDLPQTAKILTAKFCDRCALCFVIVEPRKILREIFASGQSAKIFSRENFLPYGILILCMMQINVKFQCQEVIMNRILRKPES